MPSKSLQPGIELRIAEDALAATLVLAADADVASLTAESLLQIIRDHKVVVDDSRLSMLSSVISQHRRAPQRIELSVAEASPVIHGEDGRIEWQRECRPPTTPTSNELGINSQRIDYYNQAHYIAVAAGALLGTLRPPTNGCDGRDVFGAVKKAKPGVALNLKADATIRVGSDGSLVAQSDGILHGHDSAWRIIPLFDVPASVDFSTGNIFFKGSVVVRGDVCDRFIVQASDDVTVQGVIGAATIIAGRNLQANCGMAAHDRGCLFVAGDAGVGYLHNVHGVVHGKLIARKEIINCDLAVGDALVCEAGAIIGGSIAIGQSAVVGVLGSAKGAATMLVFGSDPCREQIEHLVRTSLARPTASADLAAPAKAHWPGMMEKIRACADQSCGFGPGKSRPVNLTIQKFLHPGVIIKTGRCRVRLDQSMRGPIHIHGDAQSGLFYRMGDGVSHALADLAQQFKKTG